MWSSCCTLHSTARLDSALPFQSESEDSIHDSCCDLWPNQLNDTGAAGLGWYQRLSAWHRTFLHADLTCRVRLILWNKQHHVPMYPQSVFSCNVHKCARANKRHAGGVCDVVPSSGLEDCTSTAVGGSLAVTAHSHYLTLLHRFIACFT